MRKTPTTLFIKDEERVYGFDAINKKIRNPQNTFVYMHDFLSKPFGDSQNKAFLERYFVTYDMHEDKVITYLKFRKGNHTSLRLDTIRRIC